MDAQTLITRFLILSAKNLLDRSIRLFSSSSSSDLYCLPKFSSQHIVEEPIKNQRMELNHLKRMLKSKKHFDPDGEQCDQKIFIQKDQRCFLSKELKSEFAKICSSFLDGSWRRLSPDNIIVKHIKGGMSNMLFLCELPDSDEEDSTKTNRSCARTLLRIYFNPEIDCRLVSESVIFTLLSEKGIGPKLYGVFNDGRLEEFIKSKTLQTSDLWQPDMSRRIARKLASLHKLNLPIVKIPTYLTDAMERWFLKLQELKPETYIDVGLNDHVSLGRLHEEFRLIQKAMVRSQSPVVFCHNDLQEGNILSPTGNSDSNDLIVIDFEYASYNCRAFDFANHFCEWTFDYTNDSYPFYWFSNENFPDANQQANFFSAYLATNGQQKINVQNLIEETKQFVPVSHFFWAIWSLVQNEISPVKFGFATYAQERLKMYFRLRNDLLNLLESESYSCA